MKVVRIGIAPQARMIRERMLAIARGELKPKASDPKIWFTSMRSLSQVLSDENRALLEVIRTAKPESISELADLTGRKQGNLSRTLQTMSRYAAGRRRRALPDRGLTGRRIFLQSTPNMPEPQRLQR